MTTGSRKEQQYDPLTIPEFEKFKADCEAIGDTGWASVPKSVWRLLATIDHLRDHLPDQEHNEQAIRVLQAQRATFRALVERAYYIASQGEHDPENPDVTANETWADWWRDAEPALRDGE